MPAGTVFRVNYFVGAVLAQGGNLWFDESKIVFSPTSALDRAMGAKDVVIPFQQIRGTNAAGGLSRSFHIKTDERIHKFEGSEVQKFRELLEKNFQKKEEAAPIAPPAKSSDNSPRQTSALTCDSCKHPLQPGYCFCPACGTRPKSSCSSCHKTVDAHWAACAFCGWKFSGK